MLSRRFLPLLVIVIGVLAAVGATLWVVKPFSGGHSSAIGGPFSLTDENGGKFTEAAFANKVALVFFGYTHCPDVCPTTLYDLTQVLAKIPADAPLVAAFITVDPERDTPEFLKNYLSNFDPRIRGLSGPRENIEAAEKAYRAYARKVAGSRPDDYSYDHTALVYVMDKQGEFVSALNLTRPTEETAAELKKLF